MTVTKWTRGGGIRYEKLEQVCAVLDSTPSWLRTGEDPFTDRSWMEPTRAGGEFLRRLLNSSSKNDLFTAAEASLGFVIWCENSDLKSWHWSSHAERMFSLKDLGSGSTSVSDRLKSLMSLDDVDTLEKLLEGLRSGAIGSAWMIYGLQHLPDVKFYTLGRSIPGDSGMHIYGFTLSSEGLLGSSLVNWSGPSYGLGAHGNK